MQTKTIGMIGGISWESSATYYRLTNTLVRERVGGLANARSILLTVDLPEVVALQQAGDWETLAAMMQAGARHLEQAGADCVLLCANTMHKVAPQVERAVSIPLIHVVDVTAAAVLAAGLTRVGLLGTRYTMEQDFYRARLEQQGVQTVIPNQEDRSMVHAVVYDELTQGIVRDESRRAYQDVIEKLAQQGAEGVILGCTEIPMLIKPGDVAMPTFDTTALHAAAAVDFALA
jgi:aspartate racemase